MSLVHLHLLLNHVPIVGILFVVFVLAAALVRRGGDMGKLALLMVAGIGVVTAFVYFTGEPAEEAVEHLAGVSRSVVHEHEEAAELSFVATSIAGVLALLALWRYRGKELARWVTMGTLGVALVISGMMARTAYLGGQIRHTEIQNRVASEEDPN